MATSPTKTPPSASGADRQTAPRRRGALAGLGNEIRRHVPETIPIAIKLALTIGLLISLVMGLLGTILVYNQSRLMGAQIAASGRSMVHQLAEAAKEPTLAGDQLALGILVHNLASGGTVLGAAVVDESGHTLAAAGALPAGAATESLLAEKRGEYDWRQPDRQGRTQQVVTYAAPVRFEDVVAGHALVTLSRKFMNRSLHAMLRALAVATLIMVVLGFGLAFVVAKRLSRPIMELVDAGRAMNEGRYQYRIRERRNDELGSLINAFNGMAEGLLQKAQVEDAFTRYVAPSVARDVLANLGHVELGGRRVTGSVLFADIVGFTTLSETLNPEQVAELLNEYFSYVARASSVYQGTVDKYIGDCAMIVFGVSEEDPDHGFHAVACAILIQAVVTALNTRRAARGRPTVDFRYGITSGSMLAGNMGSKERMQYTVVGDTVNLASRLCGYAAPGRVVVSSELYGYDNVHTRLVAHEHQSIRLRGKSEPVAIYEVDSLIEPYYSEIAAHADGILSARLWAIT